MKTKKPTTWSVYREQSYTHDVSRGESPQSTGGLHTFEVRKFKGTWQTRLTQHNGKHKHVVGPFAIQPKDGEAIYSGIQE